MQPENSATVAFPPASLSVDLDNKWAYLRAAGRSDWKSVNSYLPEVTDRMADLLGELGLPLTVFLVGRDLDRDEDIAAIESLRRLGNVEFANHSLNHLPWMHTLAVAEIETEIRETHSRIESALGCRAIGFRGPGFSCPPPVLEALAKLDYAYDASTFPTSMAPIARAVFLARTRLKGEQKEKAKELYGGFASMRKPNRPYRRSVAGRTLWEIPVTVMPWVRTPIHFSYFTFLAGISTSAAKAYFATAMRLCRRTGTTPSLLLHPPDFLGCGDDRDMAYFPGMKLPRETKLALIRWALQRLSRQFTVHTLADQVRRLDRGAAVESPIAPGRSAAEAASLIKTT